MMKLKNKARIRGYLLTVILPLFLVCAPAYAQDVGFEPPPLAPELNGGIEPQTVAPKKADDSILAPVPAEAELEPLPEIDEGLPLGNTSSFEPPPASNLQAAPLPTELPDAVPSNEIPEDLFFDAEAYVPSGEMGRKAGPKKVDPRTQPATRLIIVKPGAAATTKTAQLTAAERAISLGRYDSALEIYNRLYATNPRDPNVLMGRALALQHLGRFDEAVMAYDNMLTVKPDNLEAQINMLGMMADQYPAVALKRLSDLSDRYPQNIGVVAQMAFINAKMQNYDDAIRYLGVAASIEPQNANHMYNMAVIADQAGAKKQAINYYEQALEVDTLYGSGQTIPREKVFERLARIR
ncbi:MAG: tetratricopeptide repeat protein [Micavibrio sp.]|nr:tetratricopeptide repeat protein [Micavibrio sp.]